MKLFRRLKRAWVRLTNPSRAFVDDVYDGVDAMAPPTIEQQAEAQRQLEELGYDTSQLPPIRDFYADEEA